MCNVCILSHNYYRSAWKYALFAAGWHASNFLCLTANKTLIFQKQILRRKTYHVNSIIHVLISIPHATDRRTLQKCIYLRIFAVAFLSCGRRSGSLKTSSSKFNTFIFNSLFSSKSYKGKQLYLLFLQLAILIKKLKGYSSVSFSHFFLCTISDEHLSKLWQLLKRTGCKSGNLEDYNLSTLLSADPLSSQMTSSFCYRLCLIIS